MGTEELRQSVYSSIHMSTLVKSIQTSITYPSCPFCGGSSSSKRSPKRKVALCQLTLYTNSSESFIVWCKKEEPKGMLWMRSCCIRKGQENSVELISRGCRGRCSYTLKFSNPVASEEWYRLLKQESRKVPSIGDELPSSSSADDDDLTSLDSILSEITPLSSLSELMQYSESDENSEESIDSLEPLSSPPNSFTSSSKKSKSKKTKKSVKSKVKSSPVLCNPLQALGKHKKPISNSCSSTAMTTIYPLDSIENTTDDQLSRWSWPLKA